MTSTILIGMPGSGKTTLGKQIAINLSQPFVDTDRLIEMDFDCSLQDIVNEKGNMALRKAEQETLLNHTYYNQTVATGGSVVYSEIGMKHLASFGTLVFLNTSLDELRRRIDDYETRGIAIRPGQTFDELYDERLALYRKYCNIEIDCDNKDPQTIVEEIINRLNSKN